MFSNYNYFYNNYLKNQIYYTFYANIVDMLFMHV